MFNRTLLLFLLILSCTAGFSQANRVKEIIDHDILRVKYLPYGQFGTATYKMDERINAKYRKENNAYHEILELDSLAIPYLIDKISDSTEANLRVPCAAYNLKVGDVAFALLNDIIVIPWHSVTGEDWSSYSCDALPDGGWGYLHHNRIQFQNQLRMFFASQQGRIWLRLFKDDRLNRTARTELVRKFQVLTLTPSEVASTQGE